MAAPTTEFTAHETEIPGLIIFDVTSIGDERGWFQEKYQKAKLVDAGLPSDFEAVQTNISYNKSRGVARGIHAEPWSKYVSVVSGRAYVAYVDLRAGDNFGKVVTSEIDNNKTVYIPQGVANSFQTIEDDTYYIYSVSAHWSQDLYEKYVALNMFDPALGIQWPINQTQAVVSERDNNLPLLKDIMPMDF